MYKCLRYQQSTFTNVNCIDLVCGGRNESSLIQMHAVSLTSFFTTTFIVKTTAFNETTIHKHKCVSMNSCLLINELFFLRKWLTSTSENVSKKNDDFFSSTVNHSIIF